MSGMQDCARGAARGRGGTQAQARTGDLEVEHESKAEGERDNDVGERRHPVEAGGGEPRGRSGACSVHCKHLLAGVQEPGVHERRQQHPPDAAFMLGAARGVCSRASSHAAHSGAASRCRGTPAGACCSATRRRDRRSDAELQRKRDEQALRRKNCGHCGLRQRPPLPLHVLVRHVWHQPRGLWRQWRQRHHCLQALHACRVRMRAQGSTHCRQPRPHTPEHPHADTAGLETRTYSSHFSAQAQVRTAVCRARQAAQRRARQQCLASHLQCQGNAEEQSPSERQQRQLAGRGGCAMQQRRAVEHY
jgi:hypothetical protein